jgi:hypothetical protein
VSPNPESGSGNQDVSNPPTLNAHTPLRPYSFYLKLVTAKLMYDFMDYTATLDEETSIAAHHDVHIHSTFFYTKLVQNGYAGVRKWARRVFKTDIFRLRVLIIPIHKDHSHWVCVCAFMQVSLNTHSHIGTHHRNTY